jgi:hypothetical protein
VVSVGSSYAWSGSGTASDYSACDGILPVHSDHTGGVLGLICLRARMITQSGGSPPRHVRPRDSFLSPYLIH